MKAKDCSFLVVKGQNEICISKKVLRVSFKNLWELSFFNTLTHCALDIRTASSGGFQNGLAISETPKNEAVRVQSLKQDFQLCNKAISKMIKIRTF